METELILVAFVVCALMVSYIYYKNRPLKLRPMIVGIGASVRSDDDVIVRSQPVIVNVVYAADVAIDGGLLADVVVNYKDLLSGKYLARVDERPVSAPGGSGNPLQGLSKGTASSPYEEEALPDLSDDPGSEEIEEPVGDESGDGTGERINPENINFNL